MELVDPNAVRNAERSSEPYDYLLTANLLRQDKIDDLRRDFPAIDKPGYLTVDEVKLHGRFKQLIAELEGPELTEELSKKFGMDLHQYPRLTTIMRRSQPKYGTIHTDGPSKVMTMLVYMNDAWEQDQGGRQSAEPHERRHPGERIRFDAHAHRHQHAGRTYQQLDAGQLRSALGR